MYTVGHLEPGSPGTGSALMKPLGGSLGGLQQNMADFKGFGIGSPELQSDIAMPNILSPQGVNQAMSGMMATNSNQQMNLAMQDFG